MKIRLEQLNPTIGDVNGNVALIKEAISHAQKADIDLLVLPELVVCGYIPLDLLERQDFLEAIYEANQQIVEMSRDMAVLF